VQAALVALASLPSSPRIVSETTAENRAVSWRIGAEAWAISRVVSALRTHLPELRTEREDTGNKTVDWPTAAATVHLPGSNRLPLSDSATEPVTRSLYAALAAAGKDERLCVQLVLGPPLRPRRVAEVDAGATDRLDCG